MMYLADQSTQFTPDFLTESLLWALSAADITMLLALVFVLARNIIKLVVERRRGLPFSRFRAKLVMAMLGLTIIPSVLVLIVGGELIRQTTARWFAAPIEEVLRSGQAIAVDYYAEHQTVVLGHAEQIARRLSAAALQSGDVASLRAAIEGDVRQGRVGLVEVYRVRSNGPPTPVVAVESPSLPRGHARASADLLAARIATGSGDSTTHDALDERWRTSSRRRHRSGPIVRSAHRRRDRERLPRGIDRAELTPADGRLPGLQPPARPQARPRGGLSFRLPDDDADDSCQRNMDGAVSRQADHPSGAAAGCRST